MVGSSTLEPIRSRAFGGRSSSFVRCGRDRPCAGNIAAIE
jgi:hypothetical protein